MAQEALDELVSAQDITLLESIRDGTSLAWDDEAMLRDSAIAQIDLLIRRFSGEHYGVEPRRIPRGWARNCIIVRRDTDPDWIVWRALDRAVVRLDRYMILPMEKFEVYWQELGHIKAMYFDLRERTACEYCKGERSVPTGFDANGMMMRVECLACLGTGLQQTVLRQRLRHATLP